MNQYFFILGREPALSIAELCALFERLRIAFELLSISEEAMLVATSRPLPDDFLRLAGGCPKMGKLLPIASPTDYASFVRRESGKSILFGFSIYARTQHVSAPFLYQQRKQWEREGLRLKRAFKEQGFRVRLVTSRERTLSSVVVEKNKLLNEGKELCVFVDRASFLVGETTAVQEFEAYGLRDYHRPRRNAKRGMLPPKVAQMMVNLARVDVGGTILDPFCGSGTVVQEAALLGYYVIGSDISEEAIEDTKVNFQFLISSGFTESPRQSRDNFQKNLKFSRSQSDRGSSEKPGQISNSKLFVSDVRGLSKYLAEHSIDAIVTEPYLGPPLRGNETSTHLAEIRHEVTTLLNEAFAVFRTLLREHGRVVIVLPVVGGVPLSIHAIEKEWQSIPLLPDAFLSLRGVTSRGTLLYGRSDQCVQREIAVLTPRVQ